MTNFPLIRHEPVSSGGEESSTAEAALLSGLRYDVFSHHTAFS